MEGEQPKVRGDDDSGREWDDSVTVVRQKLKEISKTDGKSRTRTSVRFKRQVSFLQSPRAALATGKRICSAKLTINFEFSRTQQQCSLVQLASIAHILKVLSKATGQLSVCKAS